MSELGRNARELIERALRDEESADGVELARMRRRVLAAGATASVLGSASKALAVLGKASVGPVFKAFGLGLAVTVLLQLLLGGKLSAVFYGAELAQPILLIGVAVTVTLTALIATWIPARRATRVEPTVALRSE